MYKKESGQVSMSDFDMPLGLKLDPNNRWVKKAALIPWSAIESRYAKLFMSNVGNVAKPLRLALGALLIQKERCVSDEEVTLQIQETPCLQYFCGFHEYRDVPPFDSSSMVHFRKRLTEEILGEINELIISTAVTAKSKALAAKDKTEPPAPNAPPSNPTAESETANPSNRGDLIVDATCAPQNIRYPQDLSLLNESRENLEGMIDKLHDSTEGGKPRTYRRTGRRDYLNTAKSRKRTEKQLRKAIGKQLNYVRRDLRIIDNYFKSGKELSVKDLERLSTLRKVFVQQEEMHKNRTHHVENRIVSLSQPWVRPIVRGKARSSCEFGAKLDISVTDGFTRVEKISFDAYNESENLMEIVERYYTRTGYYPERVLVDKIYRTIENIKFCKMHGIRLIGKPLGRPRKDCVLDKRQLRQDEIDRIEVERKFSLAKGSFGLGLIRTKLNPTSKAAIALAILAMNIAYIWKGYFRTLYGNVILYIRFFLYSLKTENLGIIQ